MSPRKTTPNERIQQIESLIQEATPAATLRLLELTEDSVARVRLAAMHALPENLCRLAARARIQDSSSLVRDEAASLLGELGDRSDIGRLAVALKDREWTVRSAAADSLGSIGGQSAVTALRFALESEKNRVVLRDITTALGRTGDKSAIPALRQTVTKAKDRTVLIAVMLALYKLGEKDMLPRAFDTLAASTDSLLPEVVTNLVQWIGVDAEDEEYVTARLEPFRSRAPDV